ARPGQRRYLLLLNVVLRWRCRSEPGPIPAMAGRFRGSCRGFRLNWGRNHAGLEPRQPGTQAPPKPSHESTYLNVLSNAPPILQMRNRLHQAVRCYELDLMGCELAVTVARL